MTIDFLIGAIRASNDLHPQVKTELEEILHREEPVEPIDRENVIEWAYKCTSPAHESEDCNECPYQLNHEGFYSCIECLLMDTVALLKEQEAVKPEHHFARHSTKPYGMEFWYTCGSCGTEIRGSDKFCHECGQAVKWDD